MSDIRNKYPSKAPILKVAESVQKSLLNDKTKLKLAKEKFNIEFKNELDGLWRRFIVNEAMASLKAKYPGLLETYVDSLGLPAAITHSLKGNDICSVGDIIQYSIGELSLLRGIGHEGCAQISISLKDVFEKYNVEEDLH